ncbi:MAG: hypothetical protein L6V93_04685 [Clostridiales bacterium]|nr:MAG: hypothetical protein L6V93_04685 [Clostridiales bacterium]
MNGTNPLCLKIFRKARSKDLSLKIDTIGADSTSGLIAEAPFLKFVPSKTDGKPVMIFEYKIPDPYNDTDKVTQERGFFYKFTNVTVSPKQKRNVFWNNIYDISGNKFASDSDGNQPAVKVTAPVGGGSAVDLVPFGIESIKITKIRRKFALYSYRRPCGDKLNLKQAVCRIHKERIFAVRDAQR